jgi:transposase
VLDNAYYQHSAAVQASEMQLGITLLFRRSYSPNRNLIPRLWRFVKGRAHHGRDHPNVVDCRGAIEESPNSLLATRTEQLKRLVTLNSQRFGDVSLMAARGILCLATHLF